MVEYSPMEHTDITQHFLFRTSSVASKAPQLHKLAEPLRRCQQWVGIIKSPQQVEMVNSLHLLLEEMGNHRLLLVDHRRQLNQILLSL